MESCVLHERTLGRSAGRAFLLPRAHDPASEQVTKASKIGDIKGKESQVRGGLLTGRERSPSGGLRCAKQLFQDLFSNFQRHEIVYALKLGVGTQ